MKPCFVQGDKGKGVALMNFLTDYSRFLQGLAIYTIFLRYLDYIAQEFWCVMRRKTEGYLQVT